MFSQGINDKVIKIIKGILHAVVYLTSNQLWLTGKKLFVKWAETVDQIVIDCGFVGKYVKDTCDYRRAAHLPGEPMSTNGMERSFRSTKDKK